VDHLEPAAYLDTIATAAPALLEAGRQSLVAPVPSCPGWVVRDVVAHLASVHRWAATAVTNPPGERPDFTEAPSDGLLEWAGQQAQLLLDALRTTDPDKDVWTFGPPRSVRFWLRRQAHETVMHAWDATAAVGTPIAFDATMAADGVAEFVEIWLPRGLKRKPGSWAGETVHLHRTDGDGEWLVRLGPDGETEVERSHAKGDLAVRASAADLLLWMTNRIDDGRVEIFGDPTLVARWRAEIAF